MRGLILDCVPVQKLVLNISVGESGDRLTRASKDVRVAAMSCIEGLFTLWPRVTLSGRKNGSAFGSQFLGELLGLLIQQQRLIVSDKNILPSFTNLLGTPCHSIFVSDSVGQRFEKSVKKDIMHFLVASALKLSAYGKLWWHN